MENLVGKITKKEVRKAYFNGTLSKLLSKIQADNDVSTEDLGKLEDYLSELRKKEGNLIDYLKEYIPEYSDDNAIKEVEASKLTNEDIKKMEESRENREKAVNLANSLIQRLGEAYLYPNKRSPNKEEIMDTVFEINSIRYFIDEEKLYREQLYKKKVIEFENFGKQRKTAEEYAKATKEYANYKRLSDLNKRIETFNMSAIKRYGGI